MDFRKMYKDKTFYLLLLITLFAVLLSIMLDSFLIRILTGLFMWLGLALSWNMVGGYMGYISFGHGAFFGLGAYLTALFMVHLSLPFFTAAILSGIITYVFGWFIGYPTLRLSGTYFAIGTWSFAEMLRQVVLVLDITGGPDGMRVPPFLNEKFFYLLMLILFFVIFLVTYIFFEKNYFGLKVKSIREDENAASSIGIDVVQVKVQVFALSAFFPALLGSSYAYWITYIHPDSVLGPIISDQMVIMVLLGGIGSLFGPILGAIVLYLGNRIIWTYLSESSVYLIILGITIMLVVLFLPEGLLSLPTRLSRKIKHYKKHPKFSFQTRRLKDNFKVKGD